MDAVSASSLPAPLPIGMETTQQVLHLCSDPFAPASLRRRQAVWSSPFFLIPLSTFRSRADNQQSQRDIPTSTSASHNMAIADWVKSKMTVIASAQSIALADDPVPVFKQLAGRAASPTSTQATPARRRNSPILRGSRRIMTQPFVPGISRW